MKNSRIDMFEVDHCVDSLNAELARKHIAPEDVVSVHDVAADAMAMSKANKARYRVFYRC